MRKPDVKSKTAAKTQQRGLQASKGDDELRAVMKTARAIGRDNAQTGSSGGARE